MRSLDKKLFRDFRRMWAQVLAIALVLASGVATLVLALGALRSLEETRAAYYDRYRFADVFADRDAGAGRASPKGSTRSRASRSSTPASASWRCSTSRGSPQPATGLVHLAARPGRRRSSTGSICARAACPRPGASTRSSINEAFANAHRFMPGAKVKAILNGRMRTLTVVGIALSPEFIYALGPGDLMPDDRRFGVFWMSRAGARRRCSISTARSTR